MRPHPARTSWSANPAGSSTSRAPTQEMVGGLGPSGRTPGGNAGRPPAQPDEAGSGRRRPGHRPPRVGGGALAHVAGVLWMMTGASLAAWGGGLRLTVLCFGPGAATRFPSCATPADANIQASVCHRGCCAAPAGPCGLPIGRTSSRAPAARMSPVGGYAPATSRAGDDRTKGEEGADGLRPLQTSGVGRGTRTPTGCPIRPSNVCVCQFRHPDKLVPKAGFEPAQAYAYCALNTACLPVPPLRRKRDSSTAPTPVQPPVAGAYRCR